jgi:hypothetical protein
VPYPNRRTFRHGACIMPRPFFVTWTVPDRPEFRYVFPDRRADGFTSDEARAFAERIRADGCRNVTVIDGARPWQWSSDGRTRIQP